jgi:DNA modification methylase
MLQQHKGHDINFTQGRIRGVSVHINEYRGCILDRIHQNILKKISWTYQRHIGGVSGRIRMYRDVSKLSGYSDIPGGVSGTHRT